MVRVWCTLSRTLQVALSYCVWVCLGEDFVAITISGTIPPKNVSPLGNVSEASAVVQIRCSFPAREKSHIHVRIALYRCTFTGDLRSDCGIHSLYCQLYEADSSGVYNVCACLCDAFQVTSHVENGYSIMTIPRATCKDAGKYKCERKSRYLTADETIMEGVGRLEMLPGPVEMTSNQDNNRSNTVPSDPLLILTCRVFSTLAVNWVWRHTDGESGTWSAISSGFATVEDIRPDLRHRCDKPSESTLTRKLEASDSGSTYLCYAQHTNRNQTYISSFAYYTFAKTVYTTTITSSTSTTTSGSTRIGTGRTKETLQPPSSLRLLVLIGLVCLMGAGLVSLTFVWGLQTAFVPLPISPHHLCLSIQSAARRVIGCFGINETDGRVGHQARWSACGCMARLRESATQARADWFVGVRVARRQPIRPDLHIAAGSASTIFHTSQTGEQILYLPHLPRQTTHPPGHTPYPPGRETHPPGTTLLPTDQTSPPSGEVMQPPGQTTHQQGQSPFATEQTPQSTGQASLPLEWSSQLAHHTPRLQEQTRDRNTVTIISSTHNTQLDGTVADAHVEDAAVTEDDAAGAESASEGSGDRRSLESQGTARRYVTAVAIESKGTNEAVTFESPETG